MTTPVPLAHAPVTTSLQDELSTSSREKQRPQSLELLVKSLANVVNSAVQNIRKLNEKTRMLALNARIEAARAGSYGAGFSVVASEMQELSNTTMGVADTLVTTTNGTINDLLSLIGNNVRGTRLSDLALTNIDLIDRCLYERTCDVRWWATDSSLTEALQSQTSDAYAYASRRLGVILDAYTVYHDLVLCDLQGRIVGNGRPSQFASVGQNVAGSKWFEDALATQSGGEYGFQKAHFSSLVNHQPSLVYSCTVRAEGNPKAAVTGVLGVVFNWAGLADPILKNLPIAAEEQGQTECLIVDEQGHILASHLGCEENAILRLPEFSRVLRESKGYFIADYRGRKSCIAHARAPGFETYSTGWYSLIIQPC